jgi:geranylgeranyl reductase family protein
VAARYAALEGAKTIILEEHACIGSPVQCAGLLGVEAMKEAGLRSSFGIRGFRGASIFSRGSSLTFRASEEKAFVLDRRLFDRRMAQEAVRDGAILRLKAAVRMVRRDGKVATLQLHDGEKVRSKVVISAEGVKGRLSRIAGITPPRKILCGAQVELPFMIDEPDKVEVHLLDHRGLFAWIIPIGEDYARIGLCAEQAACRHLKSFLNERSIGIRVRGSPVAVELGGLPLGVSSCTAADGIVAVGDAAGQVKPTSGGGIYPGIVCAKIAGGVCAAAALEGDCSQSRLMEYDMLWRKRIGGELRFGMRIHTMLDSLCMKDKDEILSAIASRPGLIRTIEEHGDIDHPGIVAARLLPGLGLAGLRLAGVLSRALFSSDDLFAVK